MAQDDVPDLEHDPEWDLSAHRRVPWLCRWHGRVRSAQCAACHREHAMWLVTGSWPAAGVRDRFEDEVSLQAVR